MIPTTIGIKAGISPNAGWAQQLRLTIDAGTIYNSHHQRDGLPCFAGNCCAPTIDDHDNAGREP